MSGRLVLVPTPIGNLGDITLRALEVFKSADLILAEDTRVSRKLMDHYDISTMLQSHHAHNEHEQVDDLVNRMQDGFEIALISDAGSPGISDPGFLLVRACVRAGVDVESLPGATALIPALTLSGIPCDRFVFEGFLPVKKGRKTRLEELRDENRTMVFYESPYRVVKTLTQFEEYFGSGRQAAACRELTKLHEEIRRGSLKELREYFESLSVKGEFVLVVAGASD
jgi:16S rRNA (cytidine1402-2'-O)-methyltransferase